MVWEDPYATYALRECIEWGFKIKLFLRHDAMVHGEDTEGQRLGILMDFIKKVLDFKLI
jgi:hypothetical protein